MQLIGVDAGGTFTDTVVTTGEGRLVVGKALSTPAAIEDGVMASLADAAARLGCTTAELVSSTDVIAHGTTAGLNALLTRTGARVGLVTTAGFESTLAIAKANKILGLGPDDLDRPTRWEKPPLLVPRRLTRGVGGRIDAAGGEVEPFDAEGARRALEELGEAGIDALAVCLLWSVADGSHERAVAELAARVLPGVHVSVSSDLVPRIGEYERTATVVLDAYVGPLVARYLGRLEARLGQEGFAGLLAVMRMGGGVLPLSMARRSPVETLHSGPVGGVSGAARLGAALRQRRVITADVGGTSFDVGLVVDGAVTYATRPMIERQALAIPVVDVTSIGTGGGSVAWLDPDLGALRVGPHSAGAEPGPACYGRGGVLPTVTDAAAVLGWLDRLGSQLRLDREAAAGALSDHVARPLGLPVEEAADGVLEVACEQMRDLVRRTAIQRGHDPADFVLYAFGGAGPQYAGRFAAGVGVSELVIPSLAAEFSAFGAVASDVSVLVERDLVPRPVTERLDELGTAASQMEAEAAARLLASAGGPLAAQPLRVRRSAGLRFYRQVHRIDVALRPGPVDAAEGDRLVREFRTRYEQIVGEGTAHDETPVELVAVTVEVALPVEPVLPSAAAGHGDGRARAAAGAAGRRRAWFAGGWRQCPVFSWDALPAGARVDGPAFVESEQTTAVVFPGLSASVDEWGNLRTVLA